MSPGQPEDVATYLAQIHLLDGELDAALAGIRGRRNAGQLTQVEAATERVSALEHHLADVARLRAEHLDGAS
jgi:hypothetical protein